jgi:uncharacterized protein involved in outer membrane biogenesis
MRKLGIGLAAILGIAVAAALLIPSFVDWRAYRTTVASHLSTITERTVVIDGDLSLSLLPRPRLRAERVRIGNIAGGSEPDMLKIRFVDAELELGPLFSGRIVVQRIAAEEPELLLEQLADGRRNWEFPAVGDKIDLILVSILDVGRGRVRLRDADRGLEYRLERAAARITAETGSGPFRIAGEVTFADTPIRVDMSLGRLDQARAPSVNASFSTRAPAARLNFSGQLARGDALKLKGRLRAEHAEARAILGQFGLPIASTIAVNLEANAEIGFAEIELSELAIGVGTTRATGSLTARFAEIPRIEAQLGIQRLDVAAWADTPPLPAKLAAGLLELSREVDLKFELSADAIALGQAALRQTRANLAVSGGEVKLASFTTLLPGSAELNGSSELRIEDGQPKAAGTFEFRSDNLRSSLDWLGLDASAVAQDRLRRLVGRARFEAGPDLLQILDLEAELDSSRLSGGVAIALRDRPAFGVNLTLDRFNLDGYLASGAGSAPGLLARLLAGLDRFDANARLRVDNLTVGQVPIDEFRLDATIDGGGIILREVRFGQIVGAEVVVTGEFRDLGRKPSVRARIEAVATDLTRLARLFAANAPAGMGPGTANASLNGDPSRVELQADLGAFGGSLRVSGEVADILLSPSFAGRIEAAHPEPARLLAASGRPAQSAVSAGALQLLATVRAAGDAVAIEAVEFKLGPLAASGTGQLALAGARPKLSLMLAANAFPLAVIMPAFGTIGPRGSTPLPPVRLTDAAGWSREPFEISPWRDFDLDLAIEAATIEAAGIALEGANLRASVDAGTARLESLSGRLAGGEVRASGAIGTHSSAGWSGTIALAGVELRPVLAGFGFDTPIDGKLTGDAKVSATGGNQSEFVRSLAGDAKFALSEGRIHGIDLARLADAIKSNGGNGVSLQMLNLVGQGATAFASLDGNFAMERGIVRSDGLNLKGAAARAGVAATVDLPKREMSLSVDLDFAAFAGAPAMSVKLEGPWDKPNRAIDLKALQNWLAVNKR